MIGLVVYRFGPQLYHVFDRIEAGGEHVAKAAASIRRQASSRNNGSDSYAVGEHRKPLLDLAEEGEENEDREFRRGRRRQGGGGGRGKEKKPPKVTEDEWEM